MTKFIQKIFLFALILLFHACATYDKIEIEKKSITLKGINIFLIGDARYINKEQTSKALLSLKENCKNATKNVILLFLGNNPKGFDDTNLQKNQASLDAQLKIAKDFKGKVILIPGNHNWNSVKGLIKPENHIENTLEKKTFLPQNSCSIDTYKVDKDIIIITVDSEWYITNCDKHPNMNDNCEIDTREIFWAELKSILDQNKNITIILAVHHPIKSNGNNDGQFEFSVLKIPINILRRASGVNPVESNYHLYREFSNRLTTLLKDYKSNTIKVSRHDNNLQYLDHNGILQIISRAGSKVKSVLHYKNNNFGYAGLGYAI